MTPLRRVMTLAPADPAHDLGLGFGGPRPVSADTLIMLFGEQQPMRGGTPEADGPSQQFCRFAKRRVGCQR